MRSEAPLWFEWLIVLLSLVGAWKVGGWMADGMAWLRKRYGRKEVSP